MNLIKRIKLKNRIKKIIQKEESKGVISVNDVMRILKEDRDSKLDYDIVYKMVNDILLSKNNF